MSEDRQVEVKGAAGWIYRAQVDGTRRRRNTGKPSNLVTLDADYGTPEYLSMLEVGAIASEFEWFVHSSRRFTFAKPRLRFFILLNRAITRDEYTAVSRILALYFDPDLKHLDKVSFRAAQMMFRPTVSKDQLDEYYFSYNPGKVVDVDALLAEFSKEHGDWRVLSNLPVVEGEVLRETAAKAENPTLKDGPIGTFCRAYTVEEAMELIPDTYTPSDENSTKPRYTYAGGTTSSGVVVEDDGLFIYSHHGSDPCSDMLVNAFDMVRIHKFGELDEKAADDTPNSKLPSFKAMMDYVVTLAPYKEQLASEKYDLMQMFEEVSDGWIEEAEDDEDEADLIEDLVGDLPVAAIEAGEAPVHAASMAPKNYFRKKKPPEDWFPDALELDLQGNLEVSLHNTATIIRNDPRMFGAVALDEMSGRLVKRRSIIPKTEIASPVYVRDEVRGDRWTDRDSVTVEAILVSPNGKGKTGYGMRAMPENMREKALLLVGQQNAFHPIKEYLWRCDDMGWDGKERVDSLFIDFLGAEDNIYHRQAARMALVASVARIFEPGHKFDYAPILQGTQGKRKSTFIEVLYGEDNFAELTCGLSDTQRIAETLGGMWGVELPEVVSLYKSEQADAKQFLSSRVDRVRMAYARHLEEFPRQCVVWGSTNDVQFLRDNTGNRRYWPIILGQDLGLIDTDRLGAERDQIWAEALTIYRQMRTEQPRGSLPLYLTDPESQRIAGELQAAAREETMEDHWKEATLEWLNTPVTLYSLYAEYNSLADLEEIAPATITEWENTLVWRTAFCANDVRRHVLGMDGIEKNNQISARLGHALRTLPGWFPAANKGGDGRLTPERRFGLPGKSRGTGYQSRWLVRAAASYVDQAMGYTTIDPEERASAPDDDFSHLI